MAELPPLGLAGDLPLGVHPASLSQVLLRFGQGSTARRNIAERLRRIHALATGTGHLSRYVIFGSFVTSTLAPNDVDVFLLMEDSFDPDQIHGETAILFNHQWAQAYFGASVFWLRRLAALGAEQAAVEHWQIKRDGGRRGIVEVISNDPER